MRAFADETKIEPQNVIRAQTKPEAQSEHLNEHPALTPTVRIFLSVLGNYIFTTNGFSIVRNPKQDSHTPTMSSTCGCRISHSKIHIFASGSPLHEPVDTIICPHRHPSHPFQITSHIPMSHQRDTLLSYKRLSDT